MIPNVATPEGRELGEHLARFCDQELRGKPDNRCSTCAFRCGDHVANGSPKTLLDALKAALERTPFWCHEADRACAGWAALCARKGTELSVPWDFSVGES
jgi:hypothetical protein